MPHTRPTKQKTYVLNGKKCFLIDIKKTNNLFATTRSSFRRFGQTIMTQHSPGLSSLDLAVRYSILMNE